MKLIMLQFKRVQKEAQDLNRKISQRTMARKWIAPDGFSFGTCPPETIDDMAKSYWFSRQGLRWWLVQAHKLQRDYREEHLGRDRERLSELDAALAALMEEESRNKMQANQFFRKQHAERQLVQGDQALGRKEYIMAKQEVTKQLQYDYDENEFYAYLAEVLIGRDTAMLTLVKQVLQSTEINQSRLLSSMDFASGLYYVCSVQGLSTQIMAEIEEIFTDDLLHISDRLEIMNSFELNKDSKDFVHHYNLLVETLDKATLFRGDLEGARKASPRAKNGRPTTTPELGFYEGAKPSDLTRESWGRVKTYEQALSILNRRNDGPFKDPGWFLRQFFTSSDVAPHFGCIHKLPRDKFLELANSFVQEDFEVEEVEAFLKYCTVVADLFTMVGNTVSGYDKGWELIDEMHIGGTLRSIELAKPVGLGELFLWLIRNKKKCDLGGPERNTTESQLLHLIRMYHPAGENNKMEKLKETLNWFDESGVLFRYRYGEIILRRIDNGWGKISTDQYYDDIIDPDEPEPYLQPLSSILRLEAVQTRLKTVFEAGPITEGELYDILQPYFQIKRLSGMANTIITRHRFHLYLRWAD
ncbi:hypothetical protein DL98DRAFT_632314 [Cadophora sp. DSE1049]|nr:hypothetical protein DL98DRAFT_632314 [Cadophora sp. DSE1049]